MYKSIHHGAANGDSAAWLAAVRPKNVVIGVGPNNYGHPTSTALNLYRKVGANVFRTDQQGTVTVRVQPGGRYAITTERRAAAPAPASAPAPRSQPAPVPVAPSASSVYYPNCAAARAAGAAPVRVGQPGYGTHLDRDRDGVGCE
ncbi:excalibur calcium-binding domain-containing protein [Deinococcus rhizophilus]|uniref:excalibur calcium-binding domain-containing protein n=1 Tax=Deinococcus rhizophilus TaxID=3049544 RepID=UPI00389908E6